jgi:hypothetical protein
MYTDLSLYYLNQMGIRPWLKRIDLSKQNTLKLLVFVHSALSIKGKSLLTQMISYLNLNQQELIIMFVQEKELLNNYDVQIAQQDPDAILILGFNKPFLPETHQNCHVIHSINPDDLIKNPLDKRKVFKDLHYLRQIIFAGNKL